MVAPVKSTVILRGALFRNSPLQIQRAINEAVNDLVDIGAPLAQRELRPGAGVLTGRFQSKIRGYRQRRRGKKVRGLIGAPGTGGMEEWIERGRRSTGRGKFRGYKPFKKTGRVLNARSQGIVDTVMRRAATRLQREP